MKTYKYIKIILIIVLLTLSTISTYSKTGSWVVVDELPTKNKALADCYILKCADSLNCISFWDITQPIGYYLIKRTTDGGNTWKDIYYDTSDYNVDINRAPGIIALSYKSPNLLIGVGDYGLVVRSTDKGETWEKYHYNDSIQLYRIFMADEYYGFAQGDYYNVKDKVIQLETEDGGRTWKQIYPRYGLSEINFIDRETLFGLSGYRDSISYKSTVIKVSNHWETYETFIRPSINNWLFAVDENNLWLTGGRQVLDSAGWERWTQNIYHSGDGGKTWETQRDTVFDAAPVHESHFHDKNFGMVCGFVGLMLITFDGGKHWIEEYVKDDIPNGWFYLMSDVQVVSPTTAIVIGSNDYIYKYTRNPVGVGEEEEFRKECKVYITNSKDYNDCSINLECEQEGKVTFQIFDLLGNEVSKTEINKTNYHASLPIDSKIRTGIYFLRVILNGSIIYSDKVSIVK